MTVQVRIATLDDADWCVAHDTLVSAEILHRKIFEEEIFVAELGGHRAAYLRLEYLWSKLPYISLIWVQENRRRQGIGRALLEFIETILREQGHRMLLSSSQADEAEPQAWHRAVGFRECGLMTGINEGGIGEIFFLKRLTETDTSG